MNVLFLVHYSELYGSIRSLLDLVSGLDSYSIVPYFIVPANGSLTEMLDSQGMEYAFQYLPAWVADKSFGILDKINLWQQLKHSTNLIVEFIRRREIELVYSNTLVSPVGILSARHANIPHILHIREYGDLDFNLKYILPKPFSKAILGRSDAIICHSLAVRNHHFKSNVKNVYQIYNGVAAKAQFDNRLKRRTNTCLNDVFTFSMMSTITPKKGQEAAVRALAELRKEGMEARLVVGGHGKREYLEYLHALCRELYLEDRVTFTGFVEDPFPLYYQSDCALVCSEHEAFSRVALEAMSTGLPVIGKNSGGNPEIIVPGKTGFLYDPFEELVACMKNMVQNPEEARQMGLAGWQRARDLFNIEDYAANVYKVILSVME